MLRVLMCSPRHYGIQYEINPWMRVGNSVDSYEATRQWKGLHATLRRLGVEISLVPPKKGSPDMVFTANAGVVHEKVFIPSHFRYKERQAERVLFVNYFKRQGYEIKDVAKGLYF